jgi:cytokinesis protein
MEAAGLRRILEVCHEFQHDSLEKQIATYEKLAASDQEALVQNFDQEVLRDLSDPYDVYRAIMSSVEGTPAYPYFLSSLQHLLLIRAEADEKMKYYQLIDELVTSIVLDKKQNFSGGLSSAVGVSVARLVAQFGEQDRSRIAEEEASNARREANELRLQKERLEEEIAKGGEGLVGSLKAKLAKTEEKLQVSRMTTNALEGRLGEQKRGYDEQISQLELQISELFRMIREGGISSRSTGPDGSVLDRTELISSLEKQMERRKTIGILEGRHRKRAGRGRGDAITEEDEDEGAEGDVTIRQMPLSGEVSRRAISGSHKRRLKGPANAPLERTSQFMDAEDERVRQHTEENLAKGTDMIVSSAITPQFDTHYHSLSTVKTPYRLERVPVVPLSDRVRVCFQAARQHGFWRTSRRRLAVVAN